jgi:hypothetical protein
MPALQAYAAAFFAIPVIRWVRNGARNAIIDARNAARESALFALRRPQPELERKLAAAARRGQRTVISERDTVYRTDRAVEDQPVNVEAASFEARLERRAAEREREQQRGGDKA